MHPTPAFQRNTPVTMETSTQQNPKPSMHAFSKDYLDDMPSFELDFGDGFEQRQVQVCTPMDVLFWFTKAVYLCSLAFN